MARHNNADTIGAGPASVKKTAYERFQQELLAGRLRPGQVVSQRELVQTLGLSIGALRELLPRLEAEGLLNVMPQRGIQITTIDLPMIRDAYQMRMAFEREATLFAVDRMPDATIEEQKRLHLESLERLKTDRTPAFFEESQDVDSRFHELLVDFTANELLIQAYDLNSIRVRLIKLDRITLSATTLPAAFGDHLAIIDAILERDRWKAAAAMETHIRNARERALAI
ncbi:DNA-binding GntR family transcriptional regulator [Devosia subaequoris]|uniref:DNA-binding GntR family transcriptional regulator n=1 Tax=Devosia subaequoris TaxID=395930 RepID=A0A7W6IKC2_9HYPH|nr:GntR family transcriptional regulator [Devosia subaequoris]MBB4051240.1 DNA-binding GntR family transcriptional regulator [Devosia subaequoris]MCP1208096.1 GntR family transcriptional regulator [Devosia subaequoris]